MIIYEPMVKPGFEWINIVNSRDYKLFFSLEGKPLGGTWKPIQVRRVPMDEKSEFVPSDFPWYGGWLIVRQGAAEKLKDIFEKNGELLPLMTDDDARLFVYNVQVVDSLDESNSDIQYIPNTDRILRIKRVAFKKSAIEGLDAFRLPLRAGPTYLSERFVARINAEGLIGLDFKEVWRF